MHYILVVGELIDMIDIRHDFNTIYFLDLHTYYKSTIEVCDCAT
jgi:hypothetical protein